ncbi:uncharacterized protein J7T54_005046 [Emericellopsis cladophorae]|uniref:Rhodopsin domain-containing protein n=1 Tax=Emericellopsis cladophorae TaxID=2686198 RepID=A0A9Q0BAQ8_9HYPO|nr:uncharacterized protein J7T54_005046 [Emericellopsis cladophorae]KAI6778522.1 hypothetical protein J7T54_005046 [Emericellopsis cladophorae]
MVPPPPFVLNEDPERVKETQTAMIIGVITAVHSIALLAVVVRTYIRLVILRSPGVQDALMVISAITALVGTIILFMQVPYGLGRHADTIPRPDLAAIGKFSFIHTVVPLLGGIGFLKISIALELKKFNGSIWRWYNITLWCLVAFVVAYTFEAWMSFIFFCQPVARQWDQSLDGSCYSIDMFIKFGLANTVFNILTDVAFATLPIPIVWSLKMPVKTRVYLILVLSLGYIAVAMGVVKAIHQINFNPMGDNTFGYDVQFWGLLQLNVGIIAACAPSLKPLVKNILRLKSVTPRYGYTNSGHRSNNSGVYTVGGGFSGTHGYARQGNRSDHAPEGFEMRSAHRGKNGEVAYTTAVGKKNRHAPPDVYASREGRHSGNESSGSQETILPLQGSKSSVRATEVKISL